MAAPALVLFDLDGVLVRYDRQGRLAALARRSGTTVEAVKEALFDSGWEDASDRGEHDSQAHADGLSRKLGVRLTVDDCVQARKAAMTVDPQMLALVTEVSRHAGVAILTNNGLMLRDYLPQICPPLFPLFSARVFCSAQFKVLKPAPEIYQRCLAALGVAETQALFVDDNPDNVDGALRAGLSGHVFRDAQTLRAALAERQLLETAADAT